MLIGLDLFWQLGELRQGSNLYTQLSESEEKHLRLTVKQLICGSLNGMRIRQSLPQSCIPRTGMRVPWKVQRLGARVREVWSDPRAKAAVDFGEMNQGEVREETVMGIACWRKGGQPRKQGDTAESFIDQSHHHNLSLFTHKHQ